MFPNLTGLWVRSCLPQPIPLRAGLSTAFPSGPPSFVLVHAAVEHLRVGAVLPNIYCSLSALLHLCNTNSLPGLRHSGVERGSQL